MGRAEGERENRGDRSRRQAVLLLALALPVLIAAYVVILTVWSRPVSWGSQLRLDQFLDLTEAGSVESATIFAADDRVLGTHSGGQRFWLDVSGGHETLFARVVGALEQASVPTSVRAQPSKALIGQLSTGLPVLILLDGFAVLYLLARGGGGGGDFSRAGARRGSADPLTFADLAGVGEAVEELAEIRDYLADPRRFAALGASVPRGVLLSGPPGVGKTRLARALAGEADVPFFSISGSDFVEMFVGVGAARIRDLFATATAAAPAIVFIDEIDAVGRARRAGPSASEEREATLNQLLVEMDGFAGAPGVVVMAATNRPDILDPALLRPGRFDRRISIDPPDAAGRAAILALHAGAKPLADDVDLTALAATTVGLSGADLANVVNEAALLATRAGVAAIGARHLAEAVERVMAGPARRSRVLTPADRARIATHEAGHAVVGAALGGVGAVAKVSVLTRGSAGGATTLVAGPDRVLATRAELEDRLVALLGGRAAEEAVLGDPSTGSNDDLARAATLARYMVAECGLGARIGPYVAGPAEGRPDGGLPSGRLEAMVEAESHALVVAAAARAAALVAANRDVLGALAAALQASESLDGEELARVLARVRCPVGGRLVRPRESAQDLWGEMVAIDPQPPELSVLAG